MKCLVTGGAGFIGSNLVDALLARGDEVTVVDDLSTGRLVNLDGALAAGAELVELDIRDAAALAALAAEREPETIFHLAAQIDVRKSLEDPAFDAAVNVGGTANVLEAARGAGSGRVVFVSTGGAIYGEGEGQQLPLDEDTAIAPLSAYGQSKYAAEGYLALYERLYGISSARPAPRQRLRPAPGPARRGGRDRDLLRPAALRRPPDRLRRRHPDPRLHIRRRRRRRGAGRRRLASRSARSTSAPAARRACWSWSRRWAGSAAPTSFEPEFAPPRAGEVQRISLDASRAEAELGWRPTVGLEDGLRLTLDSM